MTISIIVRVDILSKSGYEQTLFKLMVRRLFFPEFEIYES